MPMGMKNKYKGCQGLNNINENTTAATAPDAPKLR